MKFVNWIQNTLSNKGDSSVKRVGFAIIVVSLIALAFIATFTPYKCPQEMYDTLAWLGFGLITGTVAEKFVRDRKPKSDPPSQSGEGQ